MIILSMLSVMTYNCMFPIMNGQPTMYLLYLMYFRSRHCDKRINWTNLGLETSEHMPIEAVLPQQASAVTRTFAISVHYMIFNVILSLFAVACLCELARKIFKISTC